MNPDSLKYLQDIQDSISKIEYHIKDLKSLQDYSDNYTAVDAVERRLAIIGEALWKVSKLDPKFIVTDQRKIIALRHILIHDYDLMMMSQSGESLRII